jgi:hypothetical protein
MLFPVEIKANIDGGVPDALDALAPLLPAPDSTRRIFFADDRDGVGNGHLPLLSGGVIVRIRTGDDNDDSTAKLRPCAQAQLSGPWTAPFDEQPLKYRVEGDWSPRRRVLAASAVVEYPPGALLASAGAGADAQDALTGPQRQFLQQCAQTWRRGRTPHCAGPDRLHQMGQHSLAGAESRCGKVDGARPGFPGVVDPRQAEAGRHPGHLLGSRREGTARPAHRDRRSRLAAVHEQREQDAASPHRVAGFRAPLN